MDILKIAMSQIDIKEIHGEEDNLQIVKYAKETGILFIDNDDIPWCSTFVNWCAKKSGLKYSGKANARSWMSIGEKTILPEPGDIVVFWRGDINSWKGHVAIFLGYNSDASRVFCLGGNQGDAVSIADYDSKKVLGFRRLQKRQNIVIPMPILKKGSRGTEVIELQTLLNFLNYNCGDIDGDFGRKTQSALTRLQADNMVDPNGVYNDKTVDIIESLLQE